MLAHAADKLYDDTLASNAVAVLRIYESMKVETNGLFQMYLVTSKKVFKNESGKRVDITIAVGVLKGHGEIPNTECTIYIERKSKTSDFWILVGGDATNGVSHVKEP